MTSKVPDDLAAFNTMMVEIDKELAKLHISIPQRPLSAIGEVSGRFSLTLPITRPSNLQSEHARHWPITRRIYDWYKEQYGDKINIDPIIGRMAIQIENDVWKLRFPTIYGEILLTAEQGRPTQRDMRHGPVVYNVVDAIEGITPFRATQLTLSDRENIFECFTIGFAAFGLLDGSHEHPLVGLAKADIESAVNNLTGRSPQYGLSKWSSLQATEKMFKVVIEKAGGRYSNTHKLSTLAEQARQVGLYADWTTLIAVIQCEAGIRYGETSCSRADALNAHRASLEFINQLESVGAKLTTNLKFSPT